MGFLRKLRDARILKHGLLDGEAWFDILHQHPILDRLSDGEKSRLRDGFAPVRGLSDDLEVRLLAEEGPEPLADDPVVVHQEDGRAHSPCPLASAA